MSAERSLRLAAGVAAAILILPLLSSAAAPTLNDHSATGAPGALRPSASNTDDKIQELLLPFTGAEIGRVATTKASPVTQPRVDPAYGKLPLAFEANRGQTDSQVKFLSRGRGYTLFLTPTEAVWVLAKAEARAKRDRFPLRKPDPPQPPKVTRTVVRMKLVGANPQPRTGGLEELAGKVNYFIGKDPAKWRTNVPIYARVEYRDVYPGVNLVYYGNERQLEYDFVVAPGADPKRIRLAFEGVDRRTLDAQGNLILHTAHGKLVQRAPIVYQQINGQKQQIFGRYVLQGKDRVGFQVAAYDRTKPLVIDPVLAYSTYLGGSGQPSRIAVDTSGNAYVTGFTDSVDFPTVNAVQSTPGVPNDVFVSKLNAVGSALVYSTYLGGSDTEQAFGLAVDGAGNAYVTGFTASADFPVANALQPTLNGFTNAFLTKLGPAGALVYSTFLGGSGDDFAAGIAVDSAGNVYVAGGTDSTDFPTANALQAALGGNANAFVTKLNPMGTALVYSTYLGGSGNDFASSIAVDSAGNAYVTGLTQPGLPSTPTNFPTVNAVQPSFGGVADGFVAKLNPLGSALVYSTFLGGSGVDVANAVAVDAGGNAHITGGTVSTDFPTANAFQATNTGGGKAFVTKLDPAGARIYSTYLGGTSGEGGSDIAVDAAGSAYVTGTTVSPDFPTVNPLQAGLACCDSEGHPSSDVFVAKFDPLGSSLVYSTYLGGGASDSGFGIALDGAGNAYVTGYTQSTDFPTVNPFQSLDGNTFVVKILPSVPSFNTPSGSVVTAQIASGVAVTFPTVSFQGNTTASTSSTGPTPPAGFSLGTPPTYYDITTTAVFGSPVKVCITYVPAQFGDPNSLRLLHFEGNAWVDVTSSLDTVTNVICGQVSSLSPFVIANAGSPLSSLGPANIWVGLKNSDDVGIRFDLRAEVYRNGTQLVGSGEAASVAGGSSGFNNARQDAIVLTPVAGATFGAGETLGIKLLVRNACTGSGKNSGTARLWFNDSAAESRFDATVGNPDTYFLGDGFALATTPGLGPKKTIDVAAGAKCSAFKPFGTWSITLP